MKLTCSLLIPLLLAELSTGARAAPPDPPLGPAPLAYDGPRPTWPRRRRPQDRVKISAHGLVDLKRWPAEPPSPQGVTAEKLARVLRQICSGWMPPRRPLRYAEWILAYSAEFKIDPFLLSAVIYRNSRCIPREQTDFGIGLAKIHPRMHAGFIKKRSYHYEVLEGAQWRPRSLEMKRYSFVPGNLRRSQSDIYFAAALLAVARAQCPANDGAFRSVPHRHFVSHFIWGDRVKGARAEDRILEARRRLLEYYEGRLPAPRAKFGAMDLHCPLDGVPRVVTSVMGADRSGGKRFHKGIDFSSTYAEPVRAVADGRVVIAGMDRRRGSPVNMTNEESKAVKNKDMGPGGLFVMIQHGEDLRSAYMHLASYQVQAGQQVKAGEILGLVGKSGIQESGAHLHFELRQHGKHIDPMPHLAPYVIHPDETYLGQWVMAEEKRIRRRRRIKRWREKKAARAAEQR